MSITQINTGSAPNDGTGDTLRAAAGKINSNFTDTDNAASKLVGTDSDQVPTNADLVTQPYIKGQNLVVDGGFLVWEEGTSQTSTGYGSDTMWKNNNVGSTKTHTRQTFTQGQTDVPDNPRYYSRTVVSSVSGAGNYVIKEQSIEDVTVTAGKTVTLSFYAKADGNKNIATEFRQNFGTGGTPSTSVDGIGVTTFNLTTTKQKFSVTVDMPSMAGKTLGTDGNHILDFFFWFDAGSNFDSRTNSLGQQSGTFDISNVKLEIGDTSTDFGPVDEGATRQRVARYFERFAGGADDNMLGAAAATTISSFAVFVNFTKKRAIPAVTTNGTGEALLEGLVVPGDFTGGAAKVSNRTCYIRFFRTSGTHSSDAAALVRIGQGSSNYIDFDARL
jgi:hypothetical protein